ncbi:MAG: hypothetical protein L3J71_09760 [Victivallaceae bacterium]|nr:hypothetical protein [Victivallaceae bacterium]
MDKKIEYKSFFQKQKSFFGENSLFRVADDHFLYTESDGYKEDYKRFFFADIQAVKMIKRRDWTFIISIFVLFMVLVMFIMVVAVDGDYETGGVILIIIAIAPLVIAVYCLLVGCPVESIIKTAYGTDKVILGRRRRAEKNLHKMITYLEAAQNAPLDDAELYRLDEIEKVFRI